MSMIPLISEINFSATAFQKIAILGYVYKNYTKICKELHIEDCNTTLMSKAEYKVLLSQLLKVKDESLIREQAKEKSKCERIMREKYGKIQKSPNSLVSKYGTPI